MLQANLKAWRKEKPGQPLALHACTRIMTEIRRHREAAWDRNPLGGYPLDAWQRSTLFLDVMQRRGDSYLDQTREKMVSSLNFKAEPVLYGARLERPVNYAPMRLPMLTE